MKIVTADIMRAEDTAASEIYNIPSLLLMENAATETVAVMEKELELNGKKLLVVCGGGNNGGDGLAIARKLFCKGYDVSIFACFSETGLTESAAVNYKSVKKLNIPFVTDFSAADIIIECLLGVGLRGEVKSLAAEIISKINQSNKKVVSVDIPGGIDADSGRVCGEAVKADITVTMGYGKPGLYTGEGKAYAGRVFVADICLPPNEEAIYSLTDEQEFKKLMPPENILAHKGTNGTLGVVAGSADMPGAAALCGMAALRSGVGIVKMIVPESIKGVIQKKLTEAVFVSTEQNFFTKKSLECVLSEKVNAMVLGPGLGRNSETGEFVREVVVKSKLPLLIDADGIFAVAQNINILKEAKCEIILTPHPGEFSMLTGLSAEEINRNRVELSRNFAMDYGVTLLLKGAGTVISMPDGRTFINSNGNEGLAKGGSGDVLSGIIGAYLSRGVKYPAVCGAFAHGKAGDAAAEKIGKQSMLPTDIIKFL